MSRVNTQFGTSIGAVIVVGVLTVIINSAVGGVLKGDSNADMSDEAIAKRIEPVGKLNTGAPIVPEAAPAATETAAAASSGPRTGKQVYDGACFACHGTGAAGAPKFGNAGDWGPRIDKGIDTLLNHAINGFNAMPPRGTCSSCSDEELKNAIEYMTSNSK